MSVGPMGGLPASAAGAPLAQTKGSDTDRTRQDAADAQRRIEAGQKAEKAAGIGEADGEDHQTGERDADGRRLWEETPAAAEKSEEDPGSGPEERLPKDPSGQSGSLLDLSG